MSGVPFDRKTLEQLKKLRAMGCKRVVLSKAGPGSTNVTEVEFYDNVPPPQQKQEVTLTRKPGQWDSDAQDGEVGVNGRERLRAAHSGLKAKDLRELYRRQEEDRMES